MKKNRAIFFDRDGTLIFAPVNSNNEPKSIKNLCQLQITNSTIEVCKFLSKHFLLFLITNQPDIPRLVNSRVNVENINNFLKKKLILSDVVTNYSDDENNFFRKPNPGMILYLSKKYNINLKKSYLVGDRWRDIDAGNKVGCSTIFIDKNYNEKLNSKPKFIVKKIQQILKFVK